MMKCPDCGMRCTVRDSEVRTVYVWRQYRCVCGLSFHTGEKLIKRMDKNRAVANIIDGKRRRAAAQRARTAPEGREWFGQ